MVFNGEESFCIVFSTLREILTTFNFVDFANSAVISHSYNK